MEVPVPSSLKRRAEEVIHDLLPKKSKERYNEEYKKFCSWLGTENVERGSVSDDIMLVYLSELSKVNKPTTMWSKFSMIKSNFKIFENLDFSTYSKSISFLKQKSDGYTPTKSKVFTADQVTKFLIDSDDKEWLLSKVILTIGVFGACRKNDLLNLKFNDVKDNGNYFTVFVRDGKTPVHRSFTITDEECPYKPCMLIRKYMSLRPSSMTSDRFFVGYRCGKCVAQNVGANSIAAVPWKVAKYLGLENPEQYTGHALRRTSASMLVEGGGDLLTLKRHGGWKSSTVAEGYVEDSIARKIEVSKKLFAPVTASTSTAILDSASTIKQEVDKCFNIDDIFEESDEDLRFKGLMAPVFTAFSRDTGEINTSQIQEYAEFLVRNGVTGVLVNGTVGEGVCMSVTERKANLEAWIESSKTTKLHVMVQIGGVALKDVLDMARHAESLGVSSLLCLPDLFHRPKDASDLARYLQFVSHAAPRTPLLYYHIPSCTGVQLDMEDFLRVGAPVVPTLAGVKFTHNNLEEGSRCLRLDKGRFTVLLGNDQLIAGGFFAGFDSLIATTLNMFAPVITDIQKSIGDSQVKDSQDKQLFLIQLIDTIVQHGQWVPTMKEAMKITTGFDFGPAREPQGALKENQIKQMRSDLSAIYPR